MRKLWSRAAGSALAAAGLLALPATGSARAQPIPLIVVMMENHGYAGVVRNADMPYFNSLWNEGMNGTGPVTDYTQMYAVAHPSLPNYLALASGGVQGKVGSDTVTAGEFSVPSLWDQLTQAGISWGVFEEAMPSACYGPAEYNDTSAGGTDGQYVLRHNPGAIFAPVYTTAECQNVQPLSALNTASLPQVSFVTPNICDDDHGLPTGGADPFSNCVKSSTALAQRGDSWLEAHISAWTAAGADVLVTWDEGAGTAGASGITGGGRIASLLTGPGVSPGQDSTQYNHYSVLAGIEDLYGLPLLGAAAAASPVPLPGAAPAPVVSITQPAAGTTASGTVMVAGTAADPAGVTQVVVSVDNGTPEAATGSTSWTATIDTSALPNGTHTITATATAGNGLTSAASTTITVANPGATACPAVPAGATELSGNLSLESDQTGWTGRYTADSVVTRVEPAGGSFDGLWALQIGITSGSGNGGVNNALPVWVTATTLGAAYTGQAFVRASVAGEKVSLTLTEKTQAGKSVGSRTTTVTLPDTNWHEITTSYTARGSGNILHYALHGYLADVSQNFLADCLSLQTP